MSEISEEVQQGINDYWLTSGIPCRYFSCLKESINHPWKGHAACRYCTRIEACLETHLMAAYQAERYGGRHIYLCPASLLFWCSPVVFSGLMQGSAVGGPAVICEPDSYFIEQVRGFVTDLDAFLQEVDLLPRVTPQRARSLANILLAAMLSVSDEQLRRIYESQAIHDQQSQISAYIHGLKTMEGEKRSDMEYPMETERELLRCTYQGDKREAQRLLNELLGVLLYTTGSNLEVVKSRILELVVLLSRSAVAGGADVEQIFGINYYYLEHIRSIGSLEQLARWTDRIIERYTDLVFDLKDLRHTQKIRKAVNYLKEHYGERFSLKALAGQVGLSPPYFSSLFKVEMGRTVTDYLKEIRIQAAKEMLINSSMSIGAVSDSCGFEDQSYFSKVFKQHTGVLPSRYRETGGRSVPPDGGVYFT